MLSSHKTNNHDQQLLPQSLGNAFLLLCMGSLKSHFKDIFPFPATSLKFVSPVQTFAVSMDSSTSIKEGTSVPPKLNPLRDEMWNNLSVCWSPEIW